LLQYGWRVESETENRPAQFVQEALVGVQAITFTGQEPADEGSRAPTSWDRSDGFAIDLAHATRTWIQYGTVGFAVACIVIGAIKGVLGLLLVI
jgi:hypothetical protein